MDRELIQQVMRRDKYQYDVLLELELAGRKSYSIAGYAMVVVWVLVITIASLWKIPAWAIIGFGLIALGYISWMVVWVLRNHAKHCETLRQRIEAAGLVEQLATGTDWIEAIYSYVPWPWQLIGLGPRPTAMKGWVRLLSRNMDWFLEDPRKLFRVEWLIVFVSWLFPVGYLTVVFLGLMDCISSVVVVASFIPVLAVLAIASPMMIPSLYRRNTAAAALHRLMLERFDS